MKLEVGKFYMSRDGTKVKILSDAGDRKWRFACQYGEGPLEGKLYVDEDGLFDVHGRAHELDLIEEWKEPMEEKLKLEVGKTYITQIGAKVRIIADDFNCGANYVGILTRANESESIYTYFEDGVMSDTTATQSNLVSEYNPWSDVKVDTVVYVGSNKEPYHFAKYENGDVVSVFRGGRSSATRQDTDDTTMWPARSVSLTK